MDDIQLPGGARARWLSNGDDEGTMYVEIRGHQGTYTVLSADQARELGKWLQRTTDQEAAASHD